MPPETMLADEATERAVLAACLISEWALGHVLVELEARHFAYERHRRIFSAIRSLDADETEVDLLTLQSRLGAAGVEACGGIAYILTLDSDLPDLSRIESYVAEMKRWATRRALHDFAVKLGTMTRNTETEVGDLVEDAEALFDMATKDGRPQIPMSTPNDHAAIVEHVANREEVAFCGMATGLVDLDRLTLGMEPGHLWVLAGRPSMGKSIVAGVIARNVADNLFGRPVFFYSLEMTTSELVQRMISREVKVPYHRLRRGNLSAHERDAVLATKGNLGRVPILISERAGLRAAEVVSMSRRMATRYGGGVGLIVVDYLGLMDHAKQKGETDAHAIGRTCHAMKSLAKELRCPVLLLAQLNRESERRANRRPMLSDLRDSGDIEQDADVVVMLYREMRPAGKDEQEEPQKQDDRVLELHVVKNRHGAVGMVETWFLGDTMEVQALGRDYAA